MVLVYKCSLLVALLATLSAGLPSPIEENEDKPSYVIHNMNVNIYCYFYSNSPECKDVDGGSAATNKTDAYHEDDEDAIKTVDDFSEDISVTAPNNSPTESAVMDDKKDVTQNESGAMDVTDRYKNMAAYEGLWSHKTTTRDKFCSMCSAIISEQEAVINDRDEWLQKLHQSEDLFSYSITGSFVYVYDKMTMLKEELGMKEDESIPVEDGRDFCSSLIRQRLREGAKQPYKEALRGAERWPSNRTNKRKVDFYTEFVRNLEEDSQFMQCEPIESGIYRKLRNALSS